MNPYIEKIKAHWKSFPKDRDDFDTVLELLSYYFVIENAAETAVTRAQFSRVGEILEKLSLEDNDALFSAIVHLCDTHSTKAFTEGVCVGAQLMLEMQSSTGDS